MKTKIDYFLLKQLRFHTLYIVCVLLFIVCTIAIAVMLDVYKKESDAKVAVLKAEINELQQKKDFINYRKDLDEDSLDNIETINNSLTQLFPETEDYFSVIIALERLSQKTNFIISSYTINLQSSTPEKLSLVITGQGDRESFLRFLQNYNFAGGRLITIDKISYTTDEFSGTKLGINVYHGKTVNKDTIPVLSKEEQLLLQTIRQKMTFNVKSEASNIQDSVDYPTKEIPF